MNRKFIGKLISIIAALCLILPLFAVRVAAVNIDGNDTMTMINGAIMYELSSTNTVTVTGTPTYAGPLEIALGYGQTVIWQANAPGIQLELILNEQIQPGATPGSFNMTGGSLASLTAGANLPAGWVTISGGQAEIGEGVIDNRPAETSDETAAEPESEPEPPAEAGEIIELGVHSSGSDDPNYIPPTVQIVDNEPLEKDGVTCYGTVDIVSVDSNTPQEIPSYVLISGVRYAVGDVVYIVGENEKKIEATADTGFSYVFTAVENSDNPVKFTVEGLPEGFEMTEDGVITTTVLPTPVGTFEITVTADNGLDTNEYKMTIEIKEGGLSDKELLTALTENDVPDLLTEPQEDIPGVWTNDELSIHYEPEIDDFSAVFLDGKLLEEDVDYHVEEGSTVIILTEQTMIPLPQGDHVVTTMFNQNSDVGLDTVINDVGSSSFVFRFGDEKTSGKRVNIGGDGVTGSVTFDDTKSKEEPITAISANTEAIQERAANLSNATGREIIAAFETKQHGGFGGKTATFAVSAKSLGLSLKNGTVVYVAVYDSTIDKTYQNKGEVKDGMIVFRTKHSGVFMVATEKF
jgi:hypothetical protein